MYKFKKDTVSDIYFNQLNAVEEYKRFDDDYLKRLNHLNECVEELRKSLSPEQYLLLEKLLGAMQIFNTYNECKRFGNGMKYMNDLNTCLKNNY